MSSFKVLLFSFTSNFLSEDRNKRLYLVSVTLYKLLITTSVFKKFALENSKMSPSSNMYAVSLHHL